MDVVTDSVERHGFGKSVPFTPAHPEYLYYQKRLQSFASWPKFMRPKPEQLALCGFIYRGFSDHTTCFCCNITLSEWEPNDDVQMEHLRWSQNCAFLKMMGPMTNQSRPLSLFDTRSFNSKIDTGVDKFDTMGCLPDCPTKMEGRGTLFVKCLACPQRRREMQFKAGTTTPFVPYNKTPFNATPGLYRENFC